MQLWTNLNPPDYTCRRRRIAYTLSSARIVLWRFEIGLEPPDSGDQTPINVEIKDSSIFGWDKQEHILFVEGLKCLCSINAQSASLRSLVAAESTLQQPMQPARDHPLFLCGVWMCISIVDWNKSVPQFLGVWPWPLTFWGHLSSKIFSPFKSPYMTSYLTSIDTISLSHTIFEIFDFKVFRVWPWPLEVTWGQKHVHHSKAQTWLPI